MSDLLFSKDHWKKYFDGWNLVGISVRSKDSYYFLLREAQLDDQPSKSDVEYKTRCVGYFGFLPPDQQRIASFDIEYFNRPKIATQLHGATQVVVSKANGQVFDRSTVIRTKS